MFAHRYVCIVSLNTCGCISETTKCRIFVTQTGVLAALAEPEKLRTVYIVNEQKRKREKETLYSFIPVLHKSIR